MSVIITNTNESVIEVIGANDKVIELGNANEGVVVVSSSQGPPGASATVHDDIGPTGDGPEYNHLNDTQKALLHTAAHNIASHSDTTATGTELETLTDGSDADALHNHRPWYTYPGMAIC